MPTFRIFSCERCSRRKQRCDRALPTCTQCHESGSTCKESEKEAQTVQVSGSLIVRKGYVTTLLERLEALRKEASSRGLAIEPSADEPAAESAESNCQARFSPQQSSSSLESQTEETGPRSANVRWSLDRPGVDIDTLSLNAMAEPRSRAEEFLKQLSMPRIIVGVTETYGGNPEATSRVHSLWDSISQHIHRPTRQSRRLHIPIGEATKALETYIEVVDFRFPRLPMAKVRCGIEAISAADDGPYHDRLSSNPGSIFMAYMVIAIVPLVSDNYPISQGSFVSIHVLAECLKVLDRVFSQEDGVDIIQCLHLLVVFSIHCSAAGSAWHLIGFAMNKCIALGYHREETSLAQGQEDKEAQQQRRWAFWGCYLLDRLVCAALGRPFSIPNRDVSISLPDEAYTVSGIQCPIDSGHAHLFRYAILLTNLTDERSPESFHDQLGHLLHWRACALTNHGTSIERAHAHQTSLYHTLMLRIAIREVLSVYRWDVAGDGTSSPCYMPDGSGIWMSSAEARRVERVRVEKLSLLNICKAVSLSFGRPGMIGRNFLSLITGYNAFLMALGVLYHESVTLMDFGSKSVVTGIDNDMESSNHDWRGLLQVACDKLDITGRQFSRMNEYRQTIQQMQGFIEDRMASTGQHIDGATLQALKTAVMSIGPIHLRYLARSVLFLIAD